MQLELNVLSCIPGKRSDGVILLNVGKSTRAIRKSSEFEAVIAIDKKGNIVWQKEFDFCLMDARRSKKDTLLIMGTGGIACEIDTYGKVLHKWYSKGLHPDGHADGTVVDALKFHHSICEIDGRFICSLSIERRELAEPTEDADFVMLDSILVWDRDGTVVRTNCSR